MAGAHITNRSSKTTWKHILEYRMLILHIIH